jgi:hypothetical protein
MIMNSTERIMKKLSEIELESHEVNLANLKSTVASVDKAYKLKEKADLSAKKAKDSIIDASNAYSEAVSAFDFAKKESEDLQSKIKELGIGIPSETQTLIRNMERENSQAVEGKNKFSAIKL